MGWLAPGLFLAGVTVVVTAVGLRAQRRRPDRKWPIVAAGLIAGLVAGLAILGAVFLGDRHPRHRLLIDRLSVVVAGLVVLVGAYSYYGPPFGEGRQIETGTIERPEHGYRITIPAGWRVEDVSGADSLFGEATEAGFEPELLALDADGRASLMLATVDMGESMSPGVVAFSTTGYLKADPLIEDVSWTPVELGQHSASRIDATTFGSEGERFAEPQELSIYIVSDDERYYQTLYFSGVEAPADRWIHIAETLEYD